MSRKFWIWAAAVALVLLIVVGITITLVLVLRKHHKKTSDDTTNELNDLISENSTFPDGSYTISQKALKDGAKEKAPLYVTTWMLQYLNLVVDDSSLVAETNRLSYLFVRFPVDNTTSEKKSKRQAINNNVAVGVRFGSSDTIHVTPMNLSSIKNSGLSFVGPLPDESLVYQLQVRMGDLMCMGKDSGSCSVADWIPYAIVDGEALVGSAADFSNELPVACGSQCDAKSDSPCATSSCSQCDGQQVAGANTPVTRRYNMNTKSASGLQFSYETYTVPDRITVTYEGDAVFDSSCIGTGGQRTTPISFSGGSSELRVDVEPNCDGTTSTAWYFTLPCVAGNFSPTVPPTTPTTPQVTTSENCRTRDCEEYKCLDNERAHCGDDGYLIKYGFYFCKRFEANAGLFNTQGKRFMECVRPQLLGFIENYLDGVSGTVNCADLEEKAYDSHVPIYMNCDFCDVIESNLPWFLYVIAPNWEEAATYREICGLIHSCPKFHGDVCTIVSLAVVMATDNAVPFRVCNAICNVACA